LLLIPQPIYPRIDRLSLSAPRTLLTVQGNWFSPGFPVSPPCAGKEESGGGVSFLPTSTCHGFGTNSHNISSLNLRLSDRHMSITLLREDI